MKGNFFLSLLFLLFIVITSFFIKDNNTRNTLYILSVLIIILILLKKPLKKGYKDKANYGSHGTAEFMSNKEIKDYYISMNNLAGFFVGSLNNKDYDFDLKEKIIVPFNPPNENTNANLIISGTSGSAKTTGVIIPTILELSRNFPNHDIFCTDPKREIIDITKKQLSKTHDIYELNFIDLDLGNKINIFDFIENEDDVSRTARNIKESLFKGGNESNPYWGEMFYNILMCSIGYFYSQKKENLIFSYNIGDIIDSVNPDFYLENLKYMTNLKGQIELSARAITEAMKNGETSANLFSTVYGSLSTLGSLSLREKFSSTEIFLDLIGKNISTKDEIKKQKLIQIQTEKLILYLTEHKNQFEKKLNTLKRNYITIMIKTLQPFSDYDIYEDFMRSKILDINILDDETEITDFEKESIIKIHRQYKSALFNLESKYKEILISINEKIKENNEIKIKPKPLAIFISLPVEDRTHAPIINMIISTILKQVFRNARKCSNKQSLDIPFVFMLEEACTIGKFDFITDMLGTFRSFKIYPFFGVQSLAQIKNIYKDKYDDIMGHFNSKIMAGVNDSFTALEFEKFLGDTTIQIENNSVKVGKTDVNLSSSMVARKLLDKSELNKFDDKKVILLRKSKNPAKIFKAQYKYWEREDWKC